LGRGTPPVVRVFAEPIRCRGRCRRAVATSPEKSFPDLLSANSVCRSPVRKSRQSLPSRQWSVGRICGSGFYCQHRCCHCPRLLSFVEATSQRKLPRKVACRSIESTASVIRFTAAELTKGFSSRKRQKLTRCLKPGETRTDGCGGPLNDCEWASEPRFEVVASDQGVFRITRSIETIELFLRLFRRAAATKQFSGATKPFSRLEQNSGNGRRLSSRQQKRRPASPASPEIVGCERPASSLPSPLCCLVPRWLVRLMAVCRAWAPSPITPHRALLRLPGQSVFPFVRSR
jgi:hypothetical protein